MRFFTALTILLTSLSSFAQNSKVIDEFMSDRCQNPKSCMYTGQRPVIGFVIDGKKAIADVMAVSHNSVWLSNPREMGATGWTRKFMIKESEVNSLKTGPMQDNFCRQAFGPKFIGATDKVIEVDTKTVSNSQMALSEIRCQTKDIPKPDFTGGMVVHQELSKEQMKQINGGKQSPATK